ncbi:hypothetical protein [Paenibacillus sp. BAC0078]
MSKNVTLKGVDIERYLDEQEKSELSRIIWKIEQLKAVENDPNQLQAEVIDDVLYFSAGKE